MKEEISKYYYPCCSEKGCNGILDIKINEDNFSINYFCQNNPKHKKKNIYFKTFERFYLKELTIPKCSKCNISLEKDIRYECKSCRKIYCVFCFIYDEHIKDNNKDLLIINNKCTLHKKDLTLYCTDCHKHLCIFCHKDNEDNNHCEHDIENIYEVIPSLKEINELKEEIKKEKKIYEDYISLIDEWKKIIVNKIENYKRNIRDKISLIEKMFYNFNKYYNNYIYYENFNYFIKYHYNDKDLSNAEFLLEKNTYERFSSILKEIFSNKEKKYEIKQPHSNELENPLSNKIKKIEMINDSHFFVYVNGSIKLLRLNEEDNELIVLDNTEIDFNDDIESVTCSINKDKIYVCLSNKKIIKIFNCDLINEIMELNNNEIKGENILNDKYLKCIELPNNILAAIEDEEQVISLWNLDNYSNIKKIIINETIGDILLINSDYFISSQPNAKTLIFHNINNLNNDKIINNINSCESIHCLSSNKNYILVCCKEGISIISIKNKELIQYYDTSRDYYYSFDRCIRIDEDNDIYYLYSDSSSYNDATYIYLDILKLKEEKLIKVVKTKSRLNHKNRDKNMNIFILNKNKNYFIIEGRIFVCNEYILD